MPFPLKDGRSGAVESARVIFNVCCSMGSNDSLRF